MFGFFQYNKDELPIICKFAIVESRWANVVHVTLILDPVR